MRKRTPGLRPRMRATVVLAVSCAGWTSPSRFHLSVGGTIQRQADQFRSDLAHWVSVTCSVSSPQWLQRVRVRLSVPVASTEASGPHTACNTACRRVVDSLSRRQRPSTAPRGADQATSRCSAHYGYLMIPMSARSASAAAGGGQGRDRSADLPLFRRAGLNAVVTCGFTVKAASVRPAGGIA